MTTKSMVHLNNNLLCALDIETTGLDPYTHDIIQLALVPLDANLERRKDLPFIDFKIAPRRLERIDMQALNVSQTTLQECINSGMPSEKAADLLEDWFFRSLRLADNKRIVVLGHNVAAFDMQFLRTWLGETMFSVMFSGHTRDTLQIANFINDVCAFRGNPCPFPKLKLGEVCSAMGIDRTNFKAHDPLHDALLSSILYRKLLFHEVLTIL